MHLQDDYKKDNQPLKKLNPKTNQGNGNLSMHLQHKATYKSLSS